MPRLSCITVTYGPTPSLWPMLESLARTVDRRTTEVIVVAQPDATGSMADEIARRAPDVTLIALDRNEGFGVANNIGVSRATAEHVALLNPDLELTEGWLAPLERALDDPGVVIAAPPLLSPLGIVEEAGQVVYDDGGTDPIGGPRWPGSYDQVMFSRDVDYSSAACWLMRRDDFARVGGFSIDYAPAYFEDVDLAFRVWQSGGRCRLVVGRSVIHHHEPPSSARTALAERSRGVFETKWAAEIARQPRRPREGDNGDAIRDHRCAHHHVVTIGAGDSDDVAERKVVQAGELAQADPTERVTVVSNPRGVVEKWRRQWCPLGVEVIVAERPGAV